MSATLPQEKKEIKLKNKNKKLKIKN